MKKILLSVFAVIVIGVVIVYFFMPGIMFGIVQKIERKAGGLEQKSVVVNRMNIQYLEGGKGEPLILMVEMIRHIPRTIKSVLAIAEAEPLAPAWVASIPLLFVVG